MDSDKDKVVFDRKFFADARRKGWAKVSQRKRKEMAAAASRAYWDSLSPEQRSAEMKRRAKVRARNRAQGSPVTPLTKQSKE